MNLDDKFHELRSKYRIINRPSREFPHGKWYWDGTNIPYAKPLTETQVYYIEINLEHRGVRLGKNAPDTRI